MFQKDKNGDTEATTPEKENASDISAPPLKPFSKKGSHTRQKPPTISPSLGPIHRVDIPSRTTAIPTAPNRSTSPHSSESEERKLTVGRDIHLKGEIASCDKLVVEGSVEVKLNGAKIIDVAASGFFKGEAEVDTAVISGRFDGTLSVRDKLIVRSGGRINGTIRYGRITVDSGGEIAGDMQALAPTETKDAED
jgi:cytoskeletal protein CcmA (bactofilin family)